MVIVAGVIGLGWVVGVVALISNKSVEHRAT